MAALVTLAQVRTHVETDLSDAALQRLIDDADQAIVRRFGEHSVTGTVSEEFRAIDGETTRIFPAQPIATVTSVTEFTGSPASESSTVLATNDWRTQYGGRGIERLASGTNPRNTWPYRVVVVYTPVADGDRRILVTIDLVNLAVRYRGGDASESVGDYTAGAPATVGAYQAERRALLDELAPAGGMRFA